MSSIGRNAPLTDAAGRGFTHVLMSAMGHPVSVHKSEQLAKDSFRRVKKMGCKIIPMADALRASAG